MATYAIGDVQGCFQELQLLIQAIQFDSTKDRLWFCGDLVNRGPQSLEVLRWIYQHRDAVTIVLGNHDLYLLALFHGVCQPQHEDTLQTILAAPDVGELCGWLAQQKIVHYQAPYLLVHAGVPPIWNLQQTLDHAQQLEHALQHDPKKTLTQLFQAESSPLKLMADYFTRMRFYGEEKQAWFDWPHQLDPNLIILFGHWAALRGKTNLENRIGLDTGCVWGHELSGLRLEDRRWFSIAATQRRTE